MVCVALTFRQVSKEKQSQACDGCVPQQLAWAQDLKLKHDVQEEYF